jgi:hypothetical protein
VPNVSAPDFFPAFLAAVQKSKPMLGALLDEAASASLEGDELEIRFREGSGMMRKRLDSNESRSHLERIAGETAGRPIRIRIGNASAAEVDAAVATGAPPSDKPARETREPTPERPVPKHSAGPEALLSQATNEPGIKKLLYEFGAEVVEIRPLDEGGGAPSHDTGVVPTKEPR